MNKVIKSVICGTLCLSLFGCGSNSKQNTSEKKEVKVWAWDENFNIKALKDAEKMYEKKHKNVDIKIINMGMDDVVQKLNTGLSSGKIDNLPNVVLIEDYSAQGYLNSYLDQFQDLSSITKKSDFMDYKVAISTVNNKLYSIPFDTGVVTTYYRKDLIKKAGYSEKDMKGLTWNKFIEIGKAVKEKTGKYMIAIDPNDIAILRTIMVSAGEYYSNPKTGKGVNLKDNKILKDAINIYIKMRKANIVKVAADGDSISQAVNSGEVATAPTGCWYAPTIKQAKDQSGKWAIGDFPKIDGEKKSVNASNLGGSSWYVLKNVDGKDEAMNFMKETFASNVDLINELQSDIKLVSTLKNANKTENYKKADKFFSNQKPFEIYAEVSKKIPSVKYGNNTYVIEDILEPHVQKILDGSNMDKELKEAQSEAEDAIKK